MVDAVQHISFLVSGGGNPYPGESPSHPVVNVCVQRWRQSGAGYPIIGSHLKTDQDIDVLIDALKADLEAVRRAAKQALKTRSSPLRSRGFGNVEASDWNEQRPDL